MAMNISGELPDIPKFILDFSRKGLAEIIDAAMAESSVMEFLELNKDKNKNYPENAYPSHNTWSTFLQEINPIQSAGVENRRQLCIDIGTALEKNPEQLHYNYDSNLNALLRPAASYFAVISTLETLQIRMEDLQREAEAQDADPLYNDQLMRIKVTYLSLIALDLPSSIDDLTKVLKTRIHNFDETELNGALQTLKVQSNLAANAIHDAEVDLKTLEEAESMPFGQPESEEQASTPKKFGFRVKEALVDVTHLFNRKKKRPVSPPKEEDKVNDTPKKKPSL